MKEIHVHTRFKDYNILIGSNILAEISRLNEILLSDKFALIISSRIMELYGEYIRQSFHDYKNYEIFIMEVSE